MDEDIDIPNLVDEPTHFLFWQWDQALPVSIGLIVGILINHAFWGMLVGIYLAREYSKLKDNKPKGYFFHLIYSLGVVSENKKYKSMPSAIIERFDS